MRRDTSVAGSAFEPVVPTVLSIDGDNTMPRVMIEADSQDCE